MRLSDRYANFKWIQVKRYVDDSSLTWEERYKRLESHHQKETDFLLTEIRKLAALVDERDQKLAELGKVDTDESPEQSHRPEGN